MIEAAPALTTDKATALFEKFGIFTRSELAMREEVVYETYAKTIHVEAATMIDMASRQILPVCIQYAGDLAKAVRELAGAGVDTGVEKDLLNEITTHINRMKKALDELNTQLLRMAEIKNVMEQAFFCKDVIVPAMSELRIPADALERLVDSSMWPLPTYGELMFEV